MEFIRARRWQDWKVESYVQDIAWEATKLSEILLEL